MKSKSSEGKGIKEKKEKHYCPCCGEPSNEYGGGCKKGVKTLIDFIQSLIQSTKEETIREIMDKIVKIPLPKRLTLASNKTLSALDIYRDELLQSLTNKEKK